MSGLGNELWVFLWARKRFWLVPIVIVLAVIGGMILFTEDSSLDQFMYTVF